MELTSMRYKNYTWPHNPRVYTIDYQRVMAENKVPYGLYHLQDLGRTCRVMRGEGEFSGPKAYAQFGALANVFYDPGPGQLIHPLWQAAKVHFVELSLKQEPRPNYVSYTFTFWEDLEYYDSTLGKEEEHKESDEGNGSSIYTVVKGDSLWAIAKKYGVSLEQILRLNPQIKNPSLIHPGQEVRLR